MASSTTITAVDDTGLAPYSCGGDPVRRLRLHHVHVRRRRWSRALDALLVVEAAPEPGVELVLVDYAPLALGVRDREAAGVYAGRWAA